MELLKTFLDLYKSHIKNNSPINYQIVANILDHINFEILSIKNQDKLNKKIIIIIFLKINSKIDKTSDKIINIISYKEIQLYQYRIEQILIKLMKGALFFFMTADTKDTLIIYKNFKENKNYNIKVKDKIYDFILLENGNIVIYLSNTILIYKYSKDIFNFEKKII